MKRNFDNKLTDIKKTEQDRRTELAMLGLLMEKYPKEAEKKARELQANKRAEIAEVFSMAKLSEESQEIITAHRKIIATTQKILNETKELVSLLKGDIERQEASLIAQHKELDALLDKLDS